MRSTGSTTIARCALFAFLASTGLHAVAQDPDEPMEQAVPAAEEPEADAPGDEADADSSRWIGKVYAEISSWVAQPVGLQFVPALEADNLNPLDNRPLEINHGTRNRYRYTAGLRLKKNLGDVFFSWYSHEDRRDISETSPGEFLFIQQLTPALNAGYLGDGRSDGYAALTDAKLRDFRLNFARTAFSSERLAVRWSAGIRRVTVDTRESVRYFAIVPIEFPVIAPPVVPAARLDLIPETDTARVSSKYAGRGAEVGIRATYSMLQGRFDLEAEANVAVLRGDVDTVYSATTHYYGYFDPQGQFIRQIGAPFDEFFDRVDPSDPNSNLIVRQVRQVALPIGIRSDLSVTSLSLETSFGFRYHAWKDLDVIGGFRSVRFDDSAYRVRPVGVTLSDTGTVGSFTQDAQGRSIGYEGLYLGVSYLYGK